MNLLTRYTNKTEFSSYEDFYANFELKNYEKFNYAYDIIDEYAKIEPNKRALVWCDDLGEERTFSFADLKKLSDKAANYLESLGIGVGDKVMLILQRRYEYWYLTAALAKIGAVIIPATHLLTKKDIKFRVERANVKLIVSVNQDELNESILAVKNATFGLQAATIGNRDGFLNITDGVNSADEHYVMKHKSVGDEPLFIYFTSGTSGMPKMVVHSHTYPVCHILTAKFWLNCEDNGLHFTLAETGWAKASWGKMFGQWLCGSAVFVYDFNGKFSPLDLLPLIAKYRVTTFCAPPTVYRFLIKEDLTKFDFSSLKYMSTAGEALNPEIFRQIKDKIGLEIHEGFGQTEAVVMLATFLYNDIKVGSMGKPCPLYDIRLLDDDGNEVNTGESGEICVKSDRAKHVALFKGYYLDDELTESVWHDGYYHSGDLAFADEDGYFWFVSRKDDVIKSSGYRIGPFEVESVLLEHPAVLECAITAVPDDLRGQVVKATIILAKGYSASDELVKELQNYVKKNTAPYKYPRIVEFVDALPKTISGKIRRVALRNKD